MNKGGKNSSVEINWIEIKKREGNNVFGEFEYNTRNKI